MFVGFNLSVNDQIMYLYYTKLAEAISYVACQNFNIETFVETCH